MASFQWTSKNQAQNGVEDMVLLSKVTDDQITENLKKRFMADLIYTYIGPTLVAVNPYKKLPYFTEKEIDQYRGAAAYELPPHIYSVADRMFQSMITDEESQCVIISGESGAGKTESAKLIMNYVAAVSGKGGANNNVVDSIKNIILESNPLLESFGNAKTLRNNNSSRFGKYFEINFSRTGAPVGGKISNFLLEKSRVVGPGKGERNFHIFYQLAKSTGQYEKEQLGMMTPNYFHYLNCSGEYNADGINDADEYGEMKRAMDVCSISKLDQAAIFDILAGILHLGNVDFMEEGNNAKIAEAETLEFPAYLLGISTFTLQEKITSRMMTTGGGIGRRSSEYHVPLNVEQARGTRDALSKALYSRLFDWIVQAVNNAMEALSEKTKQPLCIGVLDIFGFEIFEKNGFEQFCINYVNERLQQIFIELTLKSEQEEYMREGIQWTPIDYFNNKIVVDLIESKKPPGIMAVLDDVCSTMHAVSDGADVKFVQKLDSACADNKHYEGHQNRFVIHHYAGSVNYDCGGFTEANKDTLYKDLVQLMQSTNKPFIKNLFPENFDEDSKKRPTTLSFKIKNQSQDLVTTLMKCTPSYVRCIKPNESKRSRDWDGRRVEHQVRYLNLKENIKVRRAGFCYRNFFEKFLRRFAILTSETFPKWTGNPHDGIKLIMKSVDMEPKEWQIGSSKVFIKSPESLFLLEEQRDRKYHGYAKVIQRAYRRWKSRKYFLEMRKKAADVVYGKKERRRFTLNREFLGDYINFLDNPVLKALVGKGEKVVFADMCVKYDRSFKPTNRELILTETALFFLGAEKEKNGPNKGKFVKVVKRKIPFSEIQSVSLSTKCDDFFVIHIPSEFDNVMESVFKTELITLLSEKYQAVVRHPLTLIFSDQIKYTVKKTTFQSGGTLQISFIADASCKRPVIGKPGKITEIRVAPGLPKDSRLNPNASSMLHKQPSIKNHLSLGRNRGAGGIGTGGRGSSVAAAGADTSYSYASPPLSKFAAASLHDEVGTASGGGGAVGAAAVVIQKSNYKNSSPYSSAGNLSTAVGANTAASRSTTNLSTVNAVSNNSLSAAAKKKAPPPPPPVKKLPMCRALYDYEGQEADELTIKVGDLITILSKEDEGWWTGSCNGRKGLFPSNYTEPA